eukprot:TRINITY_DN7892_c0_g1_i8.p1 TRINITY_DN7892_c0_g1~~TRINITY_DN7892_c0_g1_i8.p1  ORF type:complete len:288 (+),score=71.00 TRINITY_DN7892_c0_g1_i8:46-864(+)
MAFLGYLFGRQPDTSAVEQQAGLWGAEVYLVEHPELRGEDMFVTSQVVGDLVVAMPFCAGKIAVCDAKQRQLHFIEHPDLRGKGMFLTSQVVGDLVVAMPYCAGKIAVCVAMPWDARQRQLHFIEHPDLRGKGMFLTSQVVGDLVVAMPWCAGKIAVFDMTITVQVARFTQSLRLQPSNEKEVSDRTITWLKQNSSSLSEVVHRKVEAEFLDDVLPPGSNALILSRARDHLQNLVKTPGQGGGAGGGAGGGGSVPFSGPPKTFATSAFKRAY